MLIDWLKWISGQNYLHLNPVWFETFLCFICDLMKFQKEMWNQTTIVENNDWNLKFILSCNIKIIIICHSFLRKEKELLKSLETPEEKRARRLAKKVSCPILISRWLIGDIEDVLCHHYELSATVGCYLKGWPSYKHRQQYF